MDLSVTRVGNSSVIAVAGDIDVDTAYDLYLAAIKEAEAGSSQVVFDLAAINFVHSVGLGMLIRSRDELADLYESTLSLDNPSPRVLTLLELTATTDQFVISRSTDETPTVEDDANLQRGS